ncbi:MAG: hypothetical protein ACOC33_01865 [bacterium]
MNKHILRSLGWYNLKVNDIVNTFVGKARITYIGEKSLFVKFIDKIALIKGDPLTINNIKLKVTHVNRQKVKLKVTEYG